MIHNNKITLQHFKAFKNQKVWVVSKEDKIPIQTNNQPARSNDPNTWTSLDSVLTYMETHKGTLPALILNDQLDLIFIDLDNVIDPQTHMIEPWAKEIIDICDSYAEKSRSGRGIHIFLRGHPPKLPTDEKVRCRPEKKSWNKIGDFEIYFTKKIATITGSIMVDKPIRNIDEIGVLTLYRKFFPPADPVVNISPPIALSPTMSDEEIDKLARSGEKGKRFTKLYDHAEWDEPEDRSAMDLSLANRIAFFTQDNEQISRIMKKSALNDREKWEREDYIPRTIDTAIQGLSNTYQKSEPQRNHGSPIPIVLSTKTTGEPFPIKCLPSILRDMAQEMQRASKTPVELCCGAVLSAASIGTRRFVKVYEKEDLVHFTCFFFIIIAGSGERKSSVMKKAVFPIYNLQEEDKERYLQEKRAYVARQKTVQKENNYILNSERTMEDKATALESLQLNLESYRPKPYRYLTDDFTNAALFKLLDECEGSFAIMSLDGGNVLDYIQGCGPGTDGSLNDSLLLKATWGDSISRDRKSKNEEGEHLFIKDPACHVAIVVTPERCVKFLSDPRLRDSGMIARVMPILCSSTIGTRFEEENELPYNNEIVSKYNELIKTLYQRSELAEAYLNKEAADARRSFFNEIEREMGNGLSLEDLRDLGSKFTTQVTRLAALFQAFKTVPGNCKEKILITIETWYEAEAIGRWIFDQAAHLQRTDYDELVLVTAKEISEKILKSKLAKNPSNSTFKRRDFQQRFKRELKKVKMQDQNNHAVGDVLNTLVSYQWIIEVPPLIGGNRSLEFVVNKCQLKEKK